MFFFFLNEATKATTKQKKILSAELRFLRIVIGLVRIIWVESQFSGNHDSKPIPGILASRPGTSEQKYFRSNYFHLFLSFLSFQTFQTFQTSRLRKTLKIVSLKSELLIKKSIGINHNGFLHLMFDILYIYIYNIRNCYAFNRHSSITRKTTPSHFSYFSKVIGRKYFSEK